MHLFLYCQYVSSNGNILAMRAETLARLFFVVCAGTVPGPGQALRRGHSQHRITFLTALSIALASQFKFNNSFQIFVFFKIKLCTLYNFTVAVPQIDGFPSIILMKIMHLNQCIELVHPVPVQGLLQSGAGSHDCLLFSSGTSITSSEFSEVASIGPDEPSSGQKAFPGHFWAQVLEAPQCPHLSQTYTGSC